MDDLSDPLVTAEAMRPKRYFVVYKRLNGMQVETAGSRIGLFANEADAQKFARRRLNSPGIEIVAIKRESKTQIAFYAVERFVIRCLRIGSAAAIAVLVWVFLFDSPSSIGDVPLAQLTLAMLFSAIIKGAVGIAVAWGCWTLAFGEGPDLNRLSNPT